MDRLISSKRAQVVLEYAIILGIVALALGMMQVYVRRGIQAGIKIAADEIGRQEDFGNYFESVEIAEEEEVKEVIKQDTQIHRKMSSIPPEKDSAPAIEYGENGAFTVGIYERNAVVELKEGGPSYSKSWSNWREKEDE